MRLLTAAQVSQELSRRLLPDVDGARVELCSDALIVSCPDEATFSAVRGKIGHLATSRFVAIADVSAIEVRLYFRGDVIHCDRMSTEDLRGVLMACQVADILRLTEGDLFAMMAKAAIEGRSLNLVRNADHIGLFSSNPVLSSGVDQSRWLHQDMSRFWEPSELRRYMRDLEDFGDCTDYAWRAFRMDEGRQQIEQTGNIRRVCFAGMDCRLVEVKQSIILG